MKGKIKIDGLQEALDAFIDSQVLIPGRWQPVQPQQLKPNAEIAPTRENSREFGRIQRIHLIYLAGNCSPPPRC